MRRLFVALWLVPLWLALWRDISAANILTGVSVAVAVAVLMPSAAPGRRSHVVHPLRLLRFLAYFAVQLVSSNLTLAREVLTPTNRTQTGIIAVPIATRSEIVATIVANAVSLTPGTLTLEIGSEPRRYYVHVLHMQDVDHVRAVIGRLEHLADRALAAGEVATS